MVAVQKEEENNRLTGASWEGPGGPGAKLQKLHCHQASVPLVQLRLWRMRKTVPEGKKVEMEAEGRWKVHGMDRSLLSNVVSPGKS